MGDEGGPELILLRPDRPFPRFTHSDAAGRYEFVDLAAGRDGDDLVPGDFAAKRVDALQELFHQRGLLFGAEPVRLVEHQENRPPRRGQVGQRLREDRVIVVVRGAQPIAVRLRFSFPLLHVLNGRVLHHFRQRFRFGLQTQKTRQPIELFNGIGPHILVAQNEGVTYLVDPAYPLVHEINDLGQAAGSHHELKG